MTFNTFEEMWRTLIAFFAEQVSYGLTWLGDLLIACFTAGLAPGVLSTINSMGIALFTATIAILGTGFPTTMRPRKSPTDFAEFQRIYRLQYFVDAYIRGSLWFGGLCLLSTVFMAVDRRTVCDVGCENHADPTLNILASNITTLGLLMAILYVLGRAWRFRVVIQPGG